MSACRNPVGQGVWPAVSCMEVALVTALVTALACRTTARGLASAAAVGRAWWWYVIAGDLQRSCGLRTEPTLVTYRGPVQRRRVTGSAALLQRRPDDSPPVPPARTDRQQARIPCPDRAPPQQTRARQCLARPCAPAPRIGRAPDARLRRVRRARRGAPRASAEPDHLWRAAPRRSTGPLADTLANPRRSRAHSCRKARARSRRAIPCRTRVPAPGSVAALRAAGNRGGWKEEKVRIVGKHSSGTGGRPGRAPVRRRQSRSGVRRKESAFGQDWDAVCVNR